MQRVAIDVLGPLPEMESGNKCILIAMDYFSTWLEPYPLPNQEATLLPMLQCLNYSVGLRCQPSSILIKDEILSLLSLRRSAPCMGSIRHGQPPCILSRMAWLNVTTEL